MCVACQLPEMQVRKVEKFPEELDKGIEILQAISNYLGLYSVVQEETEIGVFAVEDLSWLEDQEAYVELPLI